MDKNEAIEVLKANYPSANYPRVREAVDLAIKALSMVEELYDYKCETEFKKNTGELIEKAL